MPHTARPYLLHEATYRQTREWQPTLAILPWGATEAHNWHLPHGTDTIEATALAEQAAALAVQSQARCLVLPAIPFGNNNTQLTQTATITMRTRTQLAVLYDVADSLVKQNIQKLVLLNFHGGNDFKAIIRDVMLDLPIFIVLVQGFQLAAQDLPAHLSEPRLGHADEFETSLLLHLAPHLVAPLECAGPGTTTPSQLPVLSSTPGAWYPRDWASLTADTGDGNPKAATAAKGEAILKLMVERLASLLVELAKAEEGSFPYIVRHWHE
ncbi:MAG TPA: creatininase family protein [Gemmatales bacterium]|nr:creatininase family protein [Gemmatales bacterium]